MPIRAHSQFGNCNLSLSFYCIYNSSKLFTDLDIRAFFAGTPPTANSNSCILFYTKDSTTRLILRHNIESDPSLDNVLEHAMSLLENCHQQKLKIKNSIQAVVEEHGIINILEKTRIEW
jgi:hypothetical protein